MSLSVKYEMKVMLGNFWIYGSKFYDNQIFSPNITMLKSLVGSFHKKPTLLQCYALSIFNLAQPHLKPIHCSEKFLNSYLCVKPDNSNLCNFSKNKSVKDVQERNITVKCGSGEFISAAYICDGHHDCIDKTDELKCHCNHKGQIMFDSKFCSTNCTLNINCKCSKLYQNFNFIGCKSYKQNHILFKKIKSGKSQSSLSHVQGESLKKSAAINDDLIFDYPTGKDESELLQILINYNNTCMQRGMLECYAGHSQCYSEQEKCIYNLTKETLFLMYCGNGQHLQDCYNFTCHGMFKCPNSYCIPFRYKCDGKWDCWNGNDECNCKNDTCFNMYKCYNAKVCVHTRNVCDHITDCPLSDDEILCNVNECLPKCSCINHGTLCKNITLSKDTFFSLQYYIYIQIIKSSINYVGIGHLKNTLFLILSNNDMNHKSSHLCSSSIFSIMLITLDLSYNLLENVFHQQFTCLPDLLILDLMSNKISAVKGSPFRPLQSLKFLDLSRNRIRFILSCAFCGLNKLLFLQLQGNDIFKITKDVFTNVYPKTTSTSSFYICCISEIKKSVCTAEPIWPASCKAMLGVNGLKEITWIIAMSVIIGNMLSQCKVILPQYHRKQFSEYKRLVLLMNMCELIIGCYMLTILMKDATEGLNYFYVDLIWRSSLVCYGISFMFLLSISISPLFLLAISILRYSGIKDPFEKPFSLRITKVISIHFPLLFIILIFIILYTRHNIEGITYLSSPLCVPFTKTDESVTQIITTITLSLYFVSLFLIIAVINCKLVLLTNVSVSVILESKMKDRFRNITKHVIFLGLANALCWIPSSIFLLISSFIGEFPVFWLHFVILVILPINPLLNPIIFNLSKLQFALKSISPKIVSLFKK